MHAHLSLDLPLNPNKVPHTTPIHTHPHRPPHADESEGTHP